MILITRDKVKDVLILIDYLAEFSNKFSLFEDPTKAFEFACRESHVDFEKLLEQVYVLTNTVDPIEQAMDGFFPDKPQRIDLELDGREAPAATRGSGDKLPLERR